MSGRDYQPPTASQGGQVGGAASSGGVQPMQQDEQKMNYQCGDCGELGNYRVRGPTRCLSCGGRVLYKLRTKRMIQFEAR